MYKNSSCTSCDVNTVSCSCDLLEDAVASSADGCKVTVNGEKCGETQSLQIIKEFRKLYEDKMKEIDTMACGDHEQAKISLQQDWIRDLTEQNEMLVRAVEELELEATERVQMLEVKLQNTCVSAKEVMKRYRDISLDFNLDENFQRVKRLQNDIVSLVEFIRRVRDEGVWDLGGLEFYNVKYTDLFGENELKQCAFKYKQSATNNNAKLLDKLEEKDKLIKELEEKIEKSEQFQEMNKKLQEKESLIEELKSRVEFLQHHGDIEDTYTELQKHKGKLDVLQQSMLDMRTALTAEVAEKHDIILMLRRNLQQLEEQCQQADKQTHFKDDIIKELRKEIKQLKREELQRKILNLNKENKILTNRVSDLKDGSSEVQLNILKKELEHLRKENEGLKCDIKRVKEELEKMDERANQYLTDKEEAEGKHRDSLKKIDELSTHLKKLKEDSIIREKGSCDTITSLKSEAEKYRNELELTRQNGQVAFEELRKAMIDDLEGFERRNNEKQQIINLLQDELKTEKDQHRKSIDRVIDLNNENRNQHEFIESLQYSIKELKRKPDLSNAAVNTVSQERISRGFSPKPSENKLDSDNKATLLETEEGEELEGVVSHLSTTVSKMMHSKEQTVNVKNKIANLEQQLATVNDKLQLIHNKDEIIKIQTDTLNIIQIELQALRDKEKEVEAERGRRTQEISNLKETIQELENALQNTQGRSTNLQNAVDLYLNSINVLEASEERAKIEIEQQRKTINNLQDALVVTKQELEKFKQKISEDLWQQFEIVNSMYANLIEKENQCKGYFNQVCLLLKSNAAFRDVNLDLEVEKVQFLNDLSIVENRLQKYQLDFKSYEDCICALKVKMNKMQSEKTQYESIIRYLKGEMRKLADQLCGLQKLLNTANATTLSENAEMMKNINDLKEANEELQKQLNLMEQQLVRENKINDLNRARIDELQLVINQKTAEINQWNAVYQETKRKLDSCLVQNNELHTSFVEVRNKIEEYEQEHMNSKERSNYCQNEIMMCKENLKNLIEKNCIMKQLLNKKTEECEQKKKDLEAQIKLTEFLKDECENVKIHFNQNTADLKHNVRELNETNMLLNEELKELQAKLIESAERETNQQRDYAERERELTEKIYLTQNTEVRLNDLVAQLEHNLESIKDQLHVKDEQLKSIRSNLQKGAELVQEELVIIKKELNKALQLQSKLKTENEKLRSQVVQLQSNISSFEERNQIISEQLDQCLLEIQTVQSEKEAVEQQTDEIKNELQSLQNAFSNLSREYRNKTKSMINLEMELVDTKSNQHQLCDESRQVVNNVYAWLREQKRLNNKLSSKVRAKNELIHRLKQEKQLLMKEIGNSTHFSKQCQCGDLGTPDTSLTESINEEWCTCEYMETEENNTEQHEQAQAWVNRVESMTDQLQRSNKYWQTKINENDYVVTRDQ